MINEIILWNSNYSGVILIILWACILIIPNRRKTQNQTQSFTPIKHTSHSYMANISLSISHFSTLELEYRVCVNQGKTQALKIFQMYSCIFKSLCSFRQRIPPLLLSAHPYIKASDEGCFVIAILDSWHLLHS